MASGMCFLLAENLNLDSSHAENYGNDRLLLFEGVFLIFLFSSNHSFDAFGAKIASLFISKCCPSFD